MTRNDSQPPTTASGHPPAAAIRPLLAGEGDAAAARHLHRHLEAGCSHCRDLVLRELRGRSGGTGPIPPPLAAPLHRLQLRAAALERERDEAEGRAERLVDLPPERQRLLVRNAPSYRTWGLAEHLLQRSNDQRWSLSPTVGIGSARAAVTVALGLDGAAYGVLATRDLQARAWAALGNRYRLQQRLGDARRAFAEARRRAATGSRDLALDLHLTSLEVSSLLQRGLAGEAVRRTRAALARAPGSLPRERANLLIQQGIALNREDPREALRCLSLASDLLPAEELLLRGLVRQERTSVLLGMDRPRLAERELLIMRGIFRTTAQPLATLNGTWMEGTVLQRLSDPRAARRRFRAAWKILLDVPAASPRVPQLAIERVAVELALGRLDRALEVHAEATAVLEERDFPAGVRARWAAVQDLVVRDALADEVVDEVGGELRQICYDS